MSSSDPILRWSKTLHGCTHRYRHATLTTYLSTNLGRILLHMRNDKGPIPFGQYLVDLMHRLGIETPTELANRTGQDPSTISRWVNNKTTPTPARLRQVADHLGPELYDELMAAAGHLDAAEPARTLHPTAQHVQELLGEHSPLAPHERERVAEMLEILLRQYRKLPAARRTR